MTHMEELAPLIGRLGRLYTGVVSDALDELGFWQNSMRPDIRPLAPGSFAVGRAFTILCHELYHIPNEDDPHKIEFEAIESAQRGDIIVAQCFSTLGAFWGELLTTRSQVMGLAGAVVDGYTRDTTAIISYGFPTFVRGIDPYNSIKRIDVAATGVPIVCGGVEVKTGDLVIADNDGVTVVPIELAEKALTIAERRRKSEDDVRDDLRKGATLGEVWRKYRVI
jgi:4-hydroxy-4-methyl-2-oxoglutarate aldolase